MLVGSAGWSANPKVVLTAEAGRVRCPMRPAERPKLLDRMVPPGVFCSMMLDPASRVSITVTMYSVKLLRQILVNHDDWRR